MHNRFISVTRAWAAILALILASTLSCGLLAFRAIHTHGLEYAFFVWNLFLAWVPAIAALLFYPHARRRPPPRFALVFLGIVWFLFFPNSAYIVTDIVHLAPKPHVPLWYDIITFMAFAQTGLFLAYLSLYLMQESVRARMGRAACWIFALAMLALSSFGIYLGRFLRWNSWDVLLDPMRTTRNAIVLANPFAGLEPLAFSATFFSFSLVCYLIVYSFTHLHGWTNRPPPQR